MARIGTIAQMVNIAQAVRDRIYEIACDRASRVESESGDKITSRPIAISPDLWSEGGLSFPAGFDMSADQMIVEFRFYNNGSELVCTDHSVSWKHGNAGNIELLRLGPGSRFA